MTDRYFATLIPYDHPCADNDYVAGRISAVFRLVGDTDEVVCYGIPQGFGQYDTCYVIRTTVEKYEKIKTVLEDWYRDMCKFDYPLDKIQTKLPEWL